LQLLVNTHWDTHGIALLQLLQNDHSHRYDMYNFLHQIQSVLFQNRNESIGRYQHSLFDQMDSSYNYDVQKIWKNDPKGNLHTHHDQQERLLVLVYISNKKLDLGLIDENQKDNLNIS